MHPEILAFCEQPGLLFSDELPDDDEVGDKVKTAKAQFTASFWRIVLLLCAWLLCVMLFGCSCDKRKREGRSSFQRLVCPGSCLSCKPVRDSLQQIVQPQNIVRFTLLISSVCSRQPHCSKHRRTLHFVASRQSHWPQSPVPYPLPVRRAACRMVCPVRDSHLTEELYNLQVPHCDR